jgi:hypothetical protein
MRDDEPPKGVSLAYDGPEASFRLGTPDKPQTVQGLSPVNNPDGNYI